MIWWEKFFNFLSSFTVSKSPPQLLFSMGTLIKFCGSIFLLCHWLKMYEGCVIFLINQIVDLLFLIMLSNYCYVAMLMGVCKFVKNQFVMDEKFRLDFCQFQTMNTKTSKLNKGFDVNLHWMSLWCSYNLLQSIFHFDFWWICFFINWFLMNWYRMNLPWPQDNTCFHNNFVDFHDFNWLFFPLSIKRPPFAIVSLIFAVVDICLNCMAVLLIIELLIS